MKVHHSARKHGVPEEKVLHPAQNPIWSVDLDEDSPARQLRLGFDTKGRLLEVVALTFDSGNELVIHAMKARPHLIALLE